MKCVVTGAAGFVGSHLTERLLADGHEVVGIDAFTDAYDASMKEENIRDMSASEGFRMIRGDLVNLELSGILAGTDVVFHQAAQAGVRSSWGGEFNIYLQRNVLATQCLLEACKEGPLQRFIYASSSSVYGDTTVYPTSEETLPRPLSPYGVTKLAAEHLCHLYFQNHGIPVVSLRYFTVYGPRQRPDMAFYRFLRAMCMGEPLILYGDGHQSRDFTYVSDIVDANLKAMEMGPVGGVYNIGGGSHASLLEVLDILKEVTGHKPQVQWEGMQKGDVGRTWADLHRASKDLGYHPEVDLKEGIAREYEWLRGNLAA
jgi:nucleoside-diphosphate-sugar epimerase